MKRARIYLYALGAAALVLMLGFSPVVQAGASSNENTILEFESMVGVSGQFVGANGTPVRGLHGGGLPWVITSGEGEVDSAGNVDVEVRGLVLANTPPVPPNLRLTNPVPNFRAVVSCLDAGGNPVNVSTGPFPASPQGNAEIEATVQLPRPCRDPIVFVTSPGLAWFAMSVKQTED
ncbi:MAG TPA: hypothetical protein VKF14_07330 [Candidatus Dormibacteraeota bacterium]|nr:hypothetical protein [Candidatus Dormibacteraeota bacterium]